MGVRLLKVMTQPDRPPLGLPKPDTDHRVAVGIAIVAFVAPAVSLWLMTRAVHPPVVVPAADPAYPQDAGTTCCGGDVACPEPIPWSAASETSTREQPEPGQDSPLLSTAPTHIVGPDSDARARLLGYFPFDDRLSNASQQHPPSRTINGDVRLTLGWLVEPLGSTAAEPPSKSKA